MKETSVFTMVVDYDLSKLAKLPQEVEKILKQLPDKFPDASEIISKAASGNIPNFQVNWGLILTGIREFLIKRLPWTLTGIGIGKLVEKYEDKIKEFFKRQQTELEKLKTLETKVIELRTQAQETLEQVNIFGERPNAKDNNGLPLDKKFLEERISLLNAFLAKIEAVEKELKAGMTFPLFLYHGK